MSLKSYQFKFVVKLLAFLIGAAAVAQEKNLIVIDEDYHNKESILASVPVSETVLQVNSVHSIWDDVYTTLLNDTDIKNIHLFLKTNNSKFEINNAQIGVEAIDGNLSLQKIRTNDAINRETTLFVYSCKLANNTKGIELLNSISRETNFNVISSKNCTSIFDGSFNFNYSTKGNLVNTNLILD